MICLVLALNLDLKMSSKLTSIGDSNHSDSPPSVLYGAGGLDNLSELSEDSMAPTEIYDINKTYNGFKSVKVIEAPCINCWKKGVLCLKSATSRSTKCQFCSLGKRNCSQVNHNFPESPRRLWSSIKKGGGFGLEAPVDEPPTSDATSGNSNSSTITHEVIRPTQPPQPPIRPPTRPSTLASTSTNIQPHVASTSRDPMSSEPESIFENFQHWNITGNFSDQKKVNKKVVTSPLSEVDALTEVFVDKAIKSAIPGEPTIALAQEAVAYVDTLVVKHREALKKF
ncbi:hypothetical protein O181_056350 [Austropuccinia psidii MF-1]|uniref:Uncharacterized protein n=1 Tax=Austropuccinia psidii MF-1 TaxID=1389203 RepID=A0A9Q3ECI5_9BASI|nr:hypothetical protein [Austropuccinia psidii MF-1]